MTVGETIAEPLKIFEPSLSNRERQSRVDAMLERVGLMPSMGSRYPHEFSGGQCQRVGIARAMMLSPALLICDEPVSSLDVSIQGQIVNLLLDLQRDTGTAMLFISHNLAVVRHLSHRVLVMYSGAVVEAASRDTLFSAPVHPYTRALLAAVPTVTPSPADGPAAVEPPLGFSEPPRSAAPRSGFDGPPTIEASSPPAAFGCAYRGRCAHAIAVCGTVTPPLEEVAPGHGVACHRSQELML